MSVSLTVRWVFGYHDPTGKSFGLNVDEYKECLVEHVECMGGDSGTLVFVRDSEVRLLNDRNGYQLDRPVFSFGDLPPISEFVSALDRLLATVPEENRPKTLPRWILHTDVG